MYIVPIHNGVSIATSKVQMPKTGQHNTTTTTNLLEKYVLGQACQCQPPRGQAFSSKLPPDSHAFADAADNDVDVAVGV